MSNDTVREGAVVELRYVLRDGAGGELERADSESYTHGSGAIPSGLERALEGRRVGDKLSIELGPDDAYGHPQAGAGPQPVPRSTFPKDAALSPGIQFQAESPDGAPVTLFITRIEELVVYVDTNHPYAGRTLQYDVEVLSVRD